ncbi:hypothetical protein BCV71DRAFT_262678 [Rhizopus microsporus]|uniref:Uncharacterized protein n=1 Tax=Rhizopus microsporus TaxID=58291 RepID=A0A1X0S5X5_RHIZD|nr:hypothetical protein BCV71DRAFT_262678 [Rhizopus microsporus]
MEIASPDKAILFRNTNIKLAIGEKASDATKKARKLIENHTIVRERKLGLMLESEGVALCSCEWKSIAASNAVVMKQYVKNLRVDNCMSCVKHWMMDFKEMHKLKIFVKQSYHLFTPKRPTVIRPE